MPYTGLERLAKTNIGMKGLLLVVSLSACAANGAQDLRFGDTLVDFETAGNQWCPVNTYVTWMPDDE